MITQEDLKTIRERGYSDDEIWSKLAETNSDFSTVKERGYSLEEVASITSGKPMPEPVGTSFTDKLQTATEELEAGIGRAGGAFAKSAVGSARMITDLFGANNKVSKEIAGVEDYIDQFTSAQAKQDKEEINRLFQEAEGKGLGAKVLAGLQAVAVSPETLGPEMAGYMLPSLAVGVLTGGASIPVQIGAQATMGAAQAAGSIKGDIYQSVRDYSREQGLDEVEADRAATEAQSYGGKNLDLILTNAGIGALAASTGAERIATRILTGRGQAVTKKTLGQFLKQGAVAGGVEALTEGTQEAAEQISQNIAMQREGKDVPTFQNVPQVATMGAVAGGVIGGGLKGVEFLSAEEKAERDINRSADREARSLSATDSTTKKVINDLNQSENAIDSLRQELDTLEPTDPKAQQLRMRISEEQKKAAGLKQSIGEELSEPITEAERQQAELAKAIVEEPAPTVKESLTVQPTQVAPVTEAPAAAPVEQVVTPLAEVAPAPVVSEEAAQVSEITPAPTIAEAAPVTPAPVTEQPIEAKPQRYVLQQIGATSGEWRTIQILPNKEAADAEQAKLPESATGWRIIPETPVNEQAAPAEAPAPEVAKPIGGVDYYKQLGKQDALDTNRKKKRSVPQNFKLAYENGWSAAKRKAREEAPTPAVSETITEPAAAPAGIAVGNRIKLGKSPQTYTIEEEIPQSANDKKFGEQYYNVKNEKTGETQVVEKNDMKPVSSRRRKMASEPDPLPENERYGQVKLNQRIQRYFGGKIPDRVYVVDDAVDKEKDYQAAYYPDLGILIVNNAYIKKNANVGDIIAHELGHYAFGDKKFKAAFDNFYNSLSPEDKAKVDKIVEESYNEETEESQIEESKVIAFTAYTIVNPQRRSLWNAVLDALKAFANKVFGKNFQMSDPNRTALAILSTAKRRFAAGEEIVREEEAEGPRKMAARRQQIMGEKVGPEVKTPEGIIAKTQELLRKQFDPTKVSEQNTTDAFRAIGRLTSKQGNAFAEELNDLGRVEGSEVSMGAALFVNDLFEYSIRLAAEGQKMMLGVMMTNINKLPTGAMGATGAGQTLRARLELSQRFLTMAQAEQDAYTNYVAEFIYGPNPTKEQIQSIKDAYAKVDKTEPITEEELTDELEDVGKKTGTDLVGKINIQIEEAAPPTQNPIVSAMLTLQKLYGGTIETRYTEARESAQKIKEGVKKILTGGITNYRGKMVEGAASGLESGFWKTLSSKENKPGPLGELDAAQNRELGNIVKNMLISIGLKGTPPNTKMDIYEQVASILGEKQLSKDKIKLADEKIRSEINRKRAKEIEDTEDSDAQDAINLKYDAIEHAWDEAMARQLDMPISGSMLRRLIFNELKEDKTSISDLAKLMNEEPVIGASRQDRLVNSIITKIAGVTFEGQNPADYSALKEYLGNQLEALILEKQTKAKAARAKEQLAKDAKGSVELQAERAENEAQKQIERLAKIQSDTPSFPAEAQMNPVREAVKNALKLNLNKMFDPSQSSEIISNFKKSFVKELMGLGVKEAPANILADVVGRQIEINSLNNQLKSIDRAIEKGPISEIVKAIKDTPLEDQQKPNWRYEVMRDYLRKAGLTIAQSERIAKLMDISLQKRFTMAQEQAFTDAISKSAPWKSGDTRSRRAFQKVLQALRAGALDPARNVLSDMAALNGWTGFTPEQYKSLLKNDAILSDPEAGELKKAEAYKAIQDVISKAKLPIRARDVIGQYYDAQALSGIPTLTVNAFSPIAFAMRNAIIEIGSGTFKGNPKAITNAATALVDSIKSWANTVAFSFKNNVTVYSNVDYIVNDDNLLRLYRRGVDQFKGGKTARERADGVKNMMIGMMDYVRRILNALDYGAIASLQNQNISKYSMAVMKRQGMSTKEGNEMFAVMMKAKNDFYLQQIAIGTDKNKASILADEYYVSSWSDALTKAGVEKSDIKQAMDAAINDALSSVGRNRQSLDSLKDEATKLKDAGVSSMPALWLLESMANAANQSDSQLLKLFSRVIYGFAIVPARVIRETAWFSPYGFVRFGYDAIAKKMGKTSPYAQSLGTDVQYSQRLNEAIAGTVALIALASLRGSSTDEPKEDEFKIVFTGNGPMRRDDPQFYDSWYKAGNKPNSMIVSFGKTKFTFNMMRGFEAFTWPAMMLGAVDDLEIRKKQKRDINTNTQVEDASIVAGFVFDAALRRGPYAFTTKSLFGTYGDIGVEGVAKGLTFPAKTLIPVLGASLASNLSNFLNDPIDRRTLDGAVWSNIPFIGPAVAPKSLNAFGEPALSTDMASKMFKLGVPLVYDIPTDRESIKLHELVLKQGGGPSIPTRNQLAQRLDREPTNKEYEMFVKEYGAKISSDMKRRYEELSNKTPDKYSKSIEKIGNRARDIAERKVRDAAKKP